MQARANLSVISRVTLAGLRNGALQNLEHRSYVNKTVHVFIRDANLLVHLLKLLGADKHKVASEICKRPAFRHSRHPAGQGPIPMDGKWQVGGHRVGAAG